MKSKANLPDRLIKDLARIPSVLALILFGSVARGEADKRSDIDLLVVFDERGEIKRERRNLLEILKRYRDLPLTLTKKTAEDIARDPDFFFRVFQEGYVLYKRPGTDLLPAAVTAEKQETIYTYDLGGLSRTEKLKFNSALFTREKGKYRYPGILERSGGEKLGRAVIKVPANTEKRIDELMEEHKVNYEKRRVIAVSPLER